jgi:hypothetical protein
MKFIQELLNLQEEFDSESIPPKILRLMRDADISYPGVNSLEELRVAHAKQLLARDGGEDSSERALSYALGMNGKSKDELESIVNPKTHSLTENDWHFEASNPAMSGYPTLSIMRDDGKNIDIDIYIIAHDIDEDEWQLHHVDESLNAIDPHAVLHRRDEIEDWLKRRNLPLPTDEQFDSIELYK